MAVLTETKTQPVPLGRIFCFGGESVGKLLPACSDCGPGAVPEQYKSGPFSSLSHLLLSAPSPWEQGEFGALSCLPAHLPPCAPLGFFNTYLSLCPMLCLEAVCEGREKGGEGVASREVGAWWRCLVRYGLGGELPGHGHTWLGSFELRRRVSLVVGCQAARQPPLVLCYAFLHAPGSSPLSRHVLQQPVPAMPALPALPALRPDPAGQQLQ